MGPSCKADFQKTPKMGRSKNRQSPRFGSMIWLRGLSLAGSPHEDETLTLVPPFPYFKSRRPRRAARREPGWSLDVPGNVLRCSIAPVPYP